MGIEGRVFRHSRINGKYAYAFTSQVLSESTRPFGHIQFSWPDNIESRVVRSHVRVEMELPVSVTRSDNTSIRTLLHDLSCSGAMINSPIDLGKIGDKVRTELVVKIT